MKFSEPPLRKTEPGVQCLQKRAADINSFQREWPDGIYHVLIHSSRIVPVHLLRIREGIVLCDIYELDGIKVTSSVNSAGARSLVAIKKVIIQQYCTYYRSPLTRSYFLRRLVRTSSSRQGGDALSPLPYET